MSALDQAWARINALGGVPTTDADKAYVKAIDESLRIIEELGGGYRSDADLRDAVANFGNSEPVNHDWLDREEQRAQMAAAVALPADQFLALIAAARNGLRPKAVGTGTEWLNVKDAPKEEWVILATTGGWVGQATLEYWGPNGFGEPEGAELKWFWHGSKEPIHDNHIPLGWQPMPAPPVPTGAA